MSTYISTFKKTSVQIRKFQSTFFSLSLFPTNSISATQISKSHKVLEVVRLYFMLGSSARRV